MKLVEPFRWLPFVLCVSLLNGCSDQPGELAADQSTSKKHTNRLSRETSPYLLLHAHNPVDWYAWGPEAFEKAKREKKVIFLSIGYSSCYWCHVMERLVFENEEIARYMNEHFVNIKVDREERPDVDDIYMTSLTVYFQMIGSRQGGGWPLSMFLTPEGKPFAGGTYFPPNDEKGRIGFATVTKRIVELWKDHRKDIVTNADRLTEQVRRVMKPRLLLTPVKLERELVTEVTSSLLNSHDEEHGGVDFNPRRPNGPKFPVPVKLALLQYEIGRGGDDRAAKVLYHTLDRLAAGGIYDQLAGGFHRYSTDRHWLVPHFEKMLYDQAQLADVYVEAYRQTKKPLYRETAEGIFTYVLRGMTDPSGGFYSALDAETESIEGKYYVWSSKQVDKLLGGDAKLFKQVYGMREPMVFEHGYVLHLPKPIAELAKEQNVSAADLKRRLADMRQTLLAVRAKRPPPLKDDKTLTSWNGLMIRAFANAGAVLKRDDYVKTAEKAAQFVMDQMRDKQGRLHRTYRGKQAKLNAYLDDYAFFVEGLLALHQASGNDKWLDAARKLTDDQIKLFWDEKAKGFFFTSHHHEELIARTKNAYDSVLPSGNSVSVRNLVRLAALTGEKKYLQYARETLELFAPSIQQSLRGMANMALAMGEFLDQSASGATRSETSKTGTKLIHDGIILPVAAQGADKKEEKITLKAYLSVDKLPAGGSCKIAMLVTIQDGWHINTNPAQPDFLKPTVLTMKSKHGSAVTVPNYPAGKKLTVEGIDEPLHVYEKRVVIYGTVNIPKDAAGKTEELEFQINYQACNKAKCLRPATMKLKGRLPVAAVGEPVKQINQKLFPKPTEKKKK